MIEYIPQVITPVLVSFLTGAWAVLYKKQQTLFQRYHAVNDGMKCLLRAEIIRDHSHYVNMGYIPMYAMQNVLESYCAYHSLGGNGTITKMVEELKQLPTKNEEQLY